jgi:hypothetical protein
MKLGLGNPYALFSSSGIRSSRGSQKPLLEVPGINVVVMRLGTGGKVMVLASADHISGLLFLAFFFPARWVQELIDQVFRRQIQITANRLHGIFDVIFGFYLIECLG